MARIVSPLPALLLALAACGASSDANDAGSNEAAPPAAGASRNPTAAAPATNAAAAQLVLEGEGLRLASASDGAAGALPFGTPMNRTIEALTERLDKPPSERGTQEECGGGGLDYAEWESELTAWFEAGRFIGWDNKGGLKTAGGIGLGSGRSDLAALPGLEVRQSTLGTEFSAKGLGGILQSPAPDAKITDLWGGSTCMFR